jgi:diguanylate cyclase (GGDEF)-like protein
VFVSPPDAPNDPDRLPVERVPDVEDQPLSDRDQTVSDADQTAGDRDQTASDADQTAGDRDQTASEEDELASARDQETADREQAAAKRSGGTQNPRAYARNRAARDATTHDRYVMSQLREENAAERGRAARTRDETARARDQAAHLRDGIADARDVEAHDQDRWSEALLGEASNPSLVRRQAARDRARAAADREAAARDREHAARAREEAARDRREAAAERAQAAQLRDVASTDALTGTRARGPGMADLQHEIDRARRTTGSLVLAFVDVDHLKQVNDTEGHLAGDRLLTTVATALRDGLRSYDLILRYGGDEFLCALTGIQADEVERRFGELAKRLAARTHGCSISAGIAELQDGDDTQALIARADHALIQARQSK